MARRKYTYSETGNQAMSSYVGNARTTKYGRYNGSTQTFTNPDTGKVARGGQAVSRRKRYYEVRVGLGLAGG